MTDALAIMNLSPVIPVVTLGDVDSAVAIARDLHAGGLASMEITRRTPVAFDALRAIARAVPDLCLGLGTVWTEAQAREAVDAGARFIVSPGIADEVGAVCREAGLPYLPGAHTASEIAHLVRQGWHQVKLFPASVVGGPAAIRAYAAVFPDVHFCPTGGVTEANAPDYLALDCVPCVGGSWLTQAPDDALIGSEDSPIRTAAARASRLCRRSA